MKIIVETGPPGDHPPEEYEEETQPCGVTVERTGHLTIFGVDDGETIAMFDGDDWTELKIINTGEI